MGLDLLPQSIRDRYLVHERRHACAILKGDFPEQWQDVIDCLDAFELVRSEIMEGGGRKSKITDRFDNFLGEDKTKKHRKAVAAGLAKPRGRKWSEKSTVIEMTVDGVARNFETHKVDLCKGQVAMEVEWNNKDPFFSRDLNAFRLLHDLGVIAVGVIITRADALEELFATLGRDKSGDYVKRKYGASTTHWGKLMPRVEAGGGGSCPLLLVGITERCYRDDIPDVAVAL